MPPHTILICEDEVPLRELIKAALGDEYRYEEAADGREALEQAAAVRPDLIVLDVMMPGPSGLDILTELRNGAAPEGTPVVVVSAWSHAEEEALAAGAERFVPKPFDPDGLKAIVDELLVRR